MLTDNVYKQDVKKDSKHGKHFGRRDGGGIGCEYGNVLPSWDFGRHTSHARQFRAPKRDEKHGDVE